MAGALTTSGALSVGSGFTQSGGSFNPTGIVQITQSIGNLQVQNALTGVASFSAAAPAGNITLAGVTSSGPINLSAGGSIVDPNSSGTTLQAGGAIALMAGGAIGTPANPLRMSAGLNSVTAQAVSGIALSAPQITLDGLSNTTSGAISVVSTGAIVLSDAITNAAPGGGVTLTGASVTGGQDFDTSSGASGGAIAVTASSGDVVLGNLKTYAYTSTLGAVGSGGNVTVSAATGNVTLGHIDSSAVVDYGLAPSPTTGNAGVISVTAKGIIVGAMTTDARDDAAAGSSAGTIGNAGSVNLVATAGTVTTGQISASTFRQDSSGITGNSGAVTITASGAGTSTIDNITTAEFANGGTRSPVVITINGGGSLALKDVFTLTTPGLAQSYTARSIALTGNLAVGGGNLKLATGAGGTGVTQSGGSISAGGLALTGAGQFNMTSSANSIGTLAANLSGAASGIDLVSSAGLTVGTVGGTVGIVAGSGGVSLDVGGALSIAQPISVTGGNLQLLASGLITQTAPIVADMLVAATFNDTGAAIALEDLGNVIAGVDAQTLDAAGIARVNADIDFRSTTGFDVGASGNGIATLGQVALLSGGAITQSMPIRAFAVGVNSVGGMALNNANNVIQGLFVENTGGGAVLFNNATPSLSLAGATNIGGGNITIANNGAITIIGAVGTDGGDTLVTANGQLTTTAAVYASGSLGLYSAGMSQGGGVSAGGIINLHANNGNLDINAPVDGSGPTINLFGGNMSINAAVNNNPTGTVVLNNMSGGAVSVGLGLAGFGLSNAELNNIFAAKLIFNASPVTVDGPVNLTSVGSFTLNATSLAVNNSFATSGVLNINTSGTLNVTAPLSGGSVTLNTAGIAISGAGVGISATSGSLDILGGSCVACEGKLTAVGGVTIRGVALIATSVATEMLATQTLQTLITTTNTATTTASSVGSNAEPSTKAATDIGGTTTLNLNTLPATAAGGFGGTPALTLLGGTAGGIAGSFGAPTLVDEVSGGSTFGGPIIGGATIGGSTTGGTATGGTTTGGSSSSGSGTTAQGDKKEGDKKEGDSKNQTTKSGGGKSDKPAPKKQVAVCS